MNVVATAVPVRSRSSAAIGWVILVLAVAGLAVSIATLISHYRTSATEYCDLGQTFNCDIVNRSTYSTIRKVPVAGIGVAGYVLLMALSFSRRRWAIMAMFVGALAGFGFALYLTYIEAYVLVTWCIMCLGSQTAIFLITVLSGWQLARAWRAH